MPSTCRLNDYIICCVIKVHAVPANAGGLIGYSLYSGHLKYPQNTKTKNNHHCIVFIGIANHFSYYMDIYSESS